MPEPVDTGAAAPPSAPASAPSEPAGPPTATAPQTPADGPPAAPQEADPFQALHEVTWDGQKRQVPLRELVDNYQLRRASQARFEESAQARKAVQTVVDALRAEETFWEAAKRLGHDPRQIAERYLSQIYEMEALPAHEREMRRLEQERAQFERERGAWQRQQTEAREAAAAKQYEQETTPKFQEALKAVKVPANRWAMQRMAQVALQLLDAGVDFTPAQVAATVREEYQELTGGFVQELSPEQIRETIGEERLAAIRQADIARARQQVATQQAGGARPTQPRNPDGTFAPQSQKLSWDEAFPDGD